MRGRFFVCLALAAPPRHTRLSRCSNSHKAMKNKKNLLGKFFKQKTAYSRRKRGRNTVGTRAVARRYPTKRATTNKRFLGRKMVPSIGIGHKSPR